MENKKTNTLIHSNGPRYGEGHIFLWWENYGRRLLYVDILYVEGSGSYSEFHAIDGSRVMISYRLGVMEDSLPDDTFIPGTPEFYLELALHRYICGQQRENRRPMVPGRSGLSFPFVRRATFPGTLPAK